MTIVFRPDELDSARVAPYNDRFFPNCLVLESSSHDFFDELHIPLNASLRRQILAELNKLEKDSQ